MTRFLFAFATVSCLSVSAAAVAGEPLQAGVAETDITPPLGYRMSGYFSERLSEGVLDPLQAKALYLKQGDTEAAIVFCDVVGMSLDVSNRARNRLQQELKIPREHVAVHATHSHTGPLYFGALRAHWHRRAVAEHGADPQEKIDYPEQLASKIVEAVRLARAKLRPVSLSAGYGREDRIEFNRRFHMKSGEVRFNPGYNNPNIVRVAGPIDPEVGIIDFTPAGGGRPFASLVNFAMHLDTVGGTRYSADYPYHLETALRKTLGDDFVLLFGTGTCGDINHVDVTKRERRSAAELGTLLAESVTEAMPKLKPVADVSLAMKSTTVGAPLQKYSDAEVAAAKKGMDLVDSPKVPFLDRVHAYKVMALKLRSGDTIPCEVQALRLSRDVAVVFLPGEVFVELGMHIKQESPFATTLVIELTNDTPGYIPTKKAFAEGSYETVNSRVQPGWGEKMADAAVRLLKDLEVK